MAGLQPGSGIKDPFSTQQTRLDRPGQSITFAIEHDPDVKVKQYIYIEVKRGQNIAQVCAAQALSALAVPYVWGGGHIPSQMKDDKASSGLDCSGSVSWVLYRAGMLTSPLVSGDFAGWGAAGEGPDMTVWYSANHVWIEFPLTKQQLNTVQPTAGEAGGTGPRLVSMSYSTADSGTLGTTDGAFMPRHFGSSET